MSINGFKSSECPTQNGGQVIFAKNGFWVRLKYHQGMI